MAATTETVTTTLLSTVVSTVSSATSTSSPTSTLRASPQAGVLDGANPIVYNAANPIILFIVQATIIVVFCRLLAYPLRLIGQPRVIAEVIGGILLGPSVLSRIPGFQSNIFPTISMPVLNNVANLGLILFLFLTGLEVDVRLFKRNWRVAVSVSIASMALPFGLGYAIAYGMYHQFANEPGTLPISFGVFGLFVGTALAITAFPVLCRILTELNLLGNIVGVTTLAAGVGNDVVGWILLALCVALVNNSSGLTALWALLVVFGWILCLVFAIRPAFVWLLRRNGSLQNGPSESMVCVTILLVLGSAWFTGIIGVHPIFGGFLVGIICPHDGGFAIKLTEKLEDFISAFFLPLYFALSGLSTNLGLLNDGITWAYVVGVVAVAFFGKIIGGTLSARLTNMFWRESLSIGVLMSCKGLVELIVLRTFTIFVVMAVITTVATTPLTKLLYPLWYQQKVEKFRRGEIDWDGNPIGSESSSQDASVDKLNETQVRRLLVYLRLDSLPSLFTFISLLGDSNMPSNDAIVAKKDEEPQPQPQPQVESPPRRHLQVHGIRILELTDRTSSVMKVSEVDELARRDPVVNTFRTFSQLHDVAVSGQVAVVPAASFPETLATEATETSSDFVLIPWGDKVIDDPSTVVTATSSADRFNDRSHLDFVHATLEKAVCNTGVFIDNGFGGAASSSAHTGDRPLLSRTISVMSLHSQRNSAVLPVANKSHCVFLPFFGGADDRVALRFVLQLAKNKNITATIAHVTWNSSDAATADISVPGQAHGGYYAEDPTQAAIRSKEAALEDEPSAQDLGLLATLQSSLPADLAERVSFVDIHAHGKSSSVLDNVVEHASKTVGQAPRNAGDLIVVGRRHSRLHDSRANRSVGESSSSSSGYELSKTVGVAGAHVINAKPKASVLVVQAANRDAKA
ncbi:Sodium/hydrogen exchanger family protein [Sporothrix brasiliensis 5110]|uniref:Sodium/hydrogen exchanger family protein n=1 Tax=Sporothrix brasiliensis 5110 TaxID=1398154 RepID=A0A0C2EXB9_9PEZI|nr:Sodium/hydrogen exchanger family protein [Sporothrix brasiliensis 5110]KIH91234.1 Sodium/hydrogen exchanger family protein [Sporothrix brasiliensis 5110]